MDFNKFQFNKVFSTSWKNWSLVAFIEEVISYFDEEEECSNTQSNLTFGVTISRLVRS
jgi:hypothetical protein